MLCNYIRKLTAKHSINYKNLLDTQLKIKKFQIYHNSK